jgi:transposase-like protein
MENYKDAEWLEQEYIEKDRSQAEIAAQCGVSSATINYWRR